MDTSLAATSSTLLTSIATTATTSATPVSTSTDANNSDSVPAHHASPVVAFIIGFAIILLASILNAGGLNLTKLDHVRTSAIPKASRRKDWLRPLWLLGMILYILSQLIGSTLALEYLRAEYVAPLGSSSLIFNFLFASLLIGTPVTSTDIYGTIIVILGVVGIVLFGSINSGLETEMNISRLARLWGRGNWLLYFFFWALSLLTLYAFAAQLERILASRADISISASTPVSGSLSADLSAARSGGLALGRPGAGGLGWRTKLLSKYRGTQTWIYEKLELWTAAKDEKTLAWTLGIGWACCGGGLAGGCLVFAKACVKMISGALSHENTGNQFVHVAAIATFLLLGVTAVFQIICLNRGLKAYDSTLVVPVFYGVYTASGFLNSLVFNDEIDQYKSWTLFLLFVSIFVLIAGVVLLTHKKPEAKAASKTKLAVPASRRKNAKSRSRGASKRDEEQGFDEDRDDEESVLRRPAKDDNEDEVVWDLGQASDEEDEEGGKVPESSSHSSHPQQNPHQERYPEHGEEGRGLMQLNEDGTHDSEGW